MRRENWRKGRELTGIRFSMIVFTYTIEIMSNTDLEKEVNWTRPDFGGTLLKISYPFPSQMV